jgi:ATP-dependent helicase/DNAse subunit B
MSIYTHTHVPIPDDGRFKISPSAISKFFEYPVNWYKEYILGESGFTGSTSSVLGSTVHFIAEQYALSQINGTPLDTEQLKATINADLDALDNPDVNIDEVKSLYPDMATTLVQEYVSRNIPTHVEHAVCAEYDHGVYVAGSIDAISGVSKQPDGTYSGSGTIVDYKTTATKPRTDSIPWHYYIQLMAYAWACKQQGITIDRIRIVWICRPTKTLGPRVFVVNQQISPADWQAIDDVLRIMTDSILLHEAQPELDYLVFKSLSFRQ